jgi:hypothetical protein
MADEKTLDDYKKITGISTSTPGVFEPVTEVANRALRDAAIQSSVIPNAKFIGARVVVEVWIDE